MKPFADDDKYTAHSALLGRTITSTSTLQTEDKALSNPQSVIQDLAGFNGQNCFAYTGKCVNLNDNNAMQAACGAGNTVVGWDDAGCGTKSCVSPDKGSRYIKASSPAHQRSALWKADLLPYKPSA